MSDNFWRNKNVLVAGGTGLIGMQLVPLLLNQGARVRIVSLDDPGRAPVESEFISLDLTVLDNCRRACRDMDFVFNLLGVKASPHVTAVKPASHYFPAVIMEHFLLEAARLERVAGYQMASSLAVYAPAEEFHEDSVPTSLPSPNDWFGGWAKRAGEVQIEAYRIQYNWSNLSIVRPANVYGPWDNFDSENAMVVPSLIKRALSGRPELTVLGDGRPVRDFIHARDVARGMMLVAEKNPGVPVNLGSGRGYSIRELVDCVIEHLPAPLRVIWQPVDRAGDPRRVLNIDRARSLGFSPDINLRDGIKEVMDWYAAHRDRTGSRYDVFNSDEE